jgi:ubiquinone/menaquinone biosynthesis C-methylase UbiE
MSRTAFDPYDERHVAVWDELSLWSSFAGTLLLEHVPLDARLVLDLGCGTGFPLLELAECMGPDAFVAGLDPWAAALRRVQTKARVWPVPNAAIVRGDGARMPFRSGAFDLVTSNLGVNNFADSAAALAECHRVLRPGGTLVLATNLVGHFRELYGAFARVLERLGDEAAHHRLLRHVGHRATVAGLSHTLADAGLRVEAVNKREVVMRFACAEALFTHHFMRGGFLPGWEEVAGPGAAGAAVLVALREELDARVRSEGELRLSVPIAVLLARNTAEAT